TQERKGENDEMGDPREGACRPHRVPMADQPLCRSRAAVPVRAGCGGHDRCSFDAFLERYKLDDPALHALALIVRGADTDQRDLVPEARGLYALATGFQAIS